MPTTLLTSYIALAALYTALVAVDHSLIATLPAALLALIKILPLLLLLGWTARSDSPARPQLLLALSLGACGDVLLALGHFVPGLVAFLLGHLVYLALWLTARDPQRWKRSLMAPALALPAAVWLYPTLGEMRIAVLAYLFVIVSMAIGAGLSQRCNRWGTAGVYSFLLSDFLIAWQRFAGGLPAAELTIMSTYYFAQAAICASILATTTNAPSPHRLTTPTITTRGNP